MSSLLDELRNGQPTQALRGLRAFDVGNALAQPQPGERSRAYTTDGRFLAIVVDNGEMRQWKPEKVFALRYPEGG